MTPQTAQLTPFRMAVRTNDAATRKIVCEPPDDNLPTYLVDIDFVNRQAQKVREALRRFVSQCMDEANGGVSRSGAQLKELAERGHDLYLALFDDAGQNPAGAREVREWVDAAANYRMNVVVDDRTYIPWNLVYSGDPQKLTGKPEDVGIEHYEEFWCFKYLVSSFYRSASVRGNSKSVSLYRLISALHQSAFEAAEQYLQEEGPEACILSWLRSHFDETRAFNSVYTKNDLFSSWGTHSELDMIFFYCHANGTSISFSNTEMLTMDEIHTFQLRQADRPRDSSCLFFMNGCATATGDPGGGFLEVTGRRGASGFIGTEADIPDLFAFRFGLAFLYHFLAEGLPVYQTMHRLRREHWPLSLLYSTYCSPGLQVSPTPDGPAEEITFSNFSYKRLGTTADSVI